MTVLYDIFFSTAGANKQRTIESTYKEGRGDAMDVSVGFELRCGLVHVTAITARDRRSRGGSLKRWGWEGGAGRRIYSYIMKVFCFF